MRKLLAGFVRWRFGSFRRRGMAPDCGWVGRSASVRGFRVWFWFWAAECADYDPRTGKGWLYPALFFSIWTPDEGRLFEVWDSAVDYHSVARRILVGGG